MVEYFTTYTNKIKGRIDPHFFRPEFIQFYNELEKTKFKVKTLGEITEKVTSGATPLSKSDAYTSKEEGISFIRSGDISEDKNINFDEIIYIKSEIHNKTLSGSKLKRGDILIAIVGATIGQVSLYDYDKEANINQAIALVRLKKEVNPEFVKAFMLSALGQKQLDRIKRPVARANINLDEIRGIKIILPSLSIQSKIISLIQNAYNEQKTKANKIAELLGSINDYVLCELGIKLSKLKDKMCFTVNSEEIKSKRIDPKEYSEIPRGILKAIKKAKYSQKLLSSLIEKSISGEWGKDVEGYKDNENYVLAKVLRNTNFCNRGNLDFSKVAQRMIDKEKFEKVRLKNGDILVEKSGGSPIQPVGRVAIIDDVKTDFAFSNFLQVIRVKKQECLPEYLFCFLKALYSLNYMEYIQNQTTGIKNLIMGEFLSIPVSLPSINKQREIAREYKNKWEAAEQLQEEAKNILEEAKEKIERIILEE